MRRSSSLPDTHEAVRAAAAEVEGHVDLAFLSRAHADAVEEAEVARSKRSGLAHLVGCVAEGVIAGGCEVEEGPAGRLGREAARGDARAIPRERRRDRARDRRGGLPA